MIDFNDTIPPRPEPVHYDLDEIVRRLRDTAESWVPQYFPNGRRNGPEWRLANIRGDAPRKNGSCVIALRGEHAGDWIDFDGNAGGGPLSALSEATGLESRELYAHAARLAGWTPGPPARQAPPATPSKAEHDTAREIAFILDHSMPIAGTPAAAYLTGRGLRVPEGGDLLFHPDLTYWETRRGYPGMVAMVRDRAGERTAIHRTYLEGGDNDDARVTKAAVANPRMTLGKIGRGAVRLAPLGESGVLGLSEGIESGLAVMTACTGLPVWAALNTTNLEQIMLPPAARRIVILADHDVSGAGMRAAEAAAQRLRAEGREVVIALPPAAGDDFNDVLLRDGPEAVAAFVQSAFEQQAGEDGNAPPALGGHRPIGFRGPADLPKLRADEGDLDRAVTKAWNALRSSNEPPWFFRAGGLPTWVVPDDEGRPVAVQVTEERLRHMLAKLAIWQRMVRKDEFVAAHPPTAQVKCLLATPDPGLPVLAGIVTTPVFGRGGTLLTEPGYHPDARLLYHAAPGFAVPPIPERPTNDDIAAARSLILDDLLGDFPFTSASERAHAVALLLLGFVRAMIDGPTPLHLIEKPTPGTGATLMVDVIATILTGAGASVMTEGRDEEEWRKRVTAKLRQIPSLVLIDNLRRTLDSSALAAALTAPFWEDRVLGHSEMTRLPIRCLWIATGNNPDFSNELARRLVRIRLDARVEQPWQRDSFRHPDLMGWVRANRGRLVAACLTLVRAWIAAGRPRGSRTIGSYESWAQTLGGVLDVAGIEGFLGNLEEMMEASDKEGATWRGFVSLWWERFGTADVGTADLFELASVCEPPLDLGTGTDRALRTRFGKRISKIRDRVFQLDRFSVRAETARVLHQAQRWRLVFADDPTPVETAACGETATDERSQPSHATDQGGNVGNVGGNVVGQRSPNFSFAEQQAGERWERWERVSNPYACAPARAPVKETPDKRSQRSQPSQNAKETMSCSWERSGERRNGPSHVPNPPDWLKEVL